MLFIFNIYLSFILSIKSNLVGRLLHTKLLLFTIFEHTNFKNFVFFSEFTETEPNIITSKKEGWLIKSFLNYSLHSPHFKGNLQKSNITTDKIRGCFDLNDNTYLFYYKQISI